MYVIDDIVYAGDKPNEPEIIGAVPVKNRMLLVTFSTGETRLFDTTLLTGSVFEPLSDENIFNNPSINFGTVTWNNGEIDCAPDFIYDNSYKYTLAANSDILL